MRRFHAVSLSALAGTMPSAVCGAVRADNSDPAVMFAQLRAAHESFQASQNQRMSQVEAAVNANLTSNAARSLGLGAGGLPTDPAYTEAFASFLRTGEGEGHLRELNAQGDRARINAALSVGTDSAGGYLAPTEWDRMVHKAQVIISPMRRLSNVVQTSVGGYSTVWSDNAWGSGWVGETAARPSTSNPALSTLSFASGEIYANVAITQRLLDDSLINVEEWITTELGNEFTKQEGIAFLSGNGVNKPYGLLAYAPGGVAAALHPAGALGVTNSGHATTIPNTDILITFAYALSSAYRQNATWLMNSTTAATIAKMKDGQGNYIWREGFMAGQPATLLGYPVEIDEGMPAIGADAFAVAFGDFRAGYLINDRFGTRILRDPFTNKPFVQFYATKRVGAGVLDPNAIRLLKIAV